MFHVSLPSPCHVLILPGKETDKLHSTTPEEVHVGRRFPRLHATMRALSKHGGPVLAWRRSNTLFVRRKQVPQVTLTSALCIAAMTTTRRQYLLRSSPLRFSHEEEGRRPASRAASRAAATEEASEGKTDHTQARVEAEVVRAFLQSGAHPQGQPIRTVAAHMPEEAMEYLGEQCGGLASFCRSRAAAGKPLTDANGAFFHVQFIQPQGGVAHVRLIPARVGTGNERGVKVSATLHNEARASKISTSVAGSPLRAHLGPRGMPRSRTGLLVNQFIHKTLADVLPRGRVTSVDSLRRRWKLPTSQDAADRLLALLTSLTQWECLAMEREDGSSGVKELSYPAIDPDTGFLTPEASAGIQSQFHALMRSRGSDARGEVPLDWSQYATLVCRNEKLVYVVPSGAPSTKPSDGNDENPEEGAPPQAYDLYRLAVFLPVGQRPAAVDAVAEQSAQCTTFHPMEIALTFPDRVRLHFSSSGPRREGTHRPADVDKSAVPQWTVQCGPQCYAVVEGLSYILHDTEKVALAPNPSLASMSVEELEAAKASLKHMVAPLKRAKMRKRYVREIFRRHFPQGNPFLHGEVVAQFLYDRMEPTKWYTNTQLKDDLLPGGGKDTMHVGVNFFQDYPHLFIVRHVRSTVSEVMRREQDMLDVCGDESLGNTLPPFCPEEADLWLLSSAFEDADRREDSVPNMSLVFSNLPAPQRKAIRQRGNVERFLEKFVQRYPHVFEPTGERGRFRLNRECGVALANELSAKLNSQQPQEGGEKS